MIEDRPLKLVTLLGSLRRGSFNAAVARALPDLAPSGVEVGPLPSVGDFPHYDADIQAAGFPPIVLETAATIVKADGVVIVMPEYNYSVPGALKNALDWLSRCDPQPLAGKPVAIQTASPGMIGGARAQYHLRQVLVFLDADVLNKPEVMIGQVASKITDGELTDDLTRDHLKAQLGKLVERIHARAG